MRGILKLGGLQLSDLRYSSFERGLIDELFPNGKHGDKLYYLSMSRNRANSFVNDQMFRRILFRFCLRGRSISKYGRIVPINYFNDVRIRGEMEDRLISDHNLIPLSLVDHVDVFINGSLGNEDFALLRAIEVRVPCRYFTTKMNFLMGRNAVEIGDLSGYELEVDEPSEIHGNESRIDALGRYLSGDYSDADLDEIRWRDAWWISNHGKKKKITTEPPITITPQNFASNKKKPAARATKIPAQMPCNFLSVVPRITLPKSTAAKSHIGIKNSEVTARNIE